MNAQQALNFLLSLIIQAKFNVSPNEMAGMLQQLDIAKQVLSDAITPAAQPAATPEAATAVPNA